MYVNNRDQINYHRFLKNARTKSGASQAQVASGVCTASSYNRAELGVRVPEKLMRDRFTSRMGFSSERYVEYLGLEEFQQWQKRQNIVMAIAEGKMETAETLLEDYEKITDLENAVQLQFIKSMRFFILQKKGASEKELFIHVQQAVECTVLNIDKALIGVHLLADQELNLIAEYMRLQKYMGVPSNESTWRILEYQKLITYMNHSFMEDLTKVKVYPKVTCFICEELLKEDASEYRLLEAWKLCDKSMKLLKDTHRLYYFLEILEFKKEILCRLRECGAETVRAETIDEELQKTIMLEMKWKAYYEEYDLPFYMNDSTYLYWETECYNAAEVLGKRRKMLQLPRATLCDGICTERSLIRIEKTSLSLSMYVLNNLFERMGLCAEYRRGQVVSWETDVLKIYQELTEALNNSVVETSEMHLEKLRNELNMNLSFNQQEIKRAENICAARKETVSAETLQKEIEDALECTLPVWALYNQKSNVSAYYTRSELACIHDLAFMVCGSHSEYCAAIIKAYCEEHIEKGLHPAKIGMIEFLMGGLTSYLYAMGDEEKAKHLRWKLMKSCLFYKRIPFELENPEKKQVMLIE